MNSFGSNVNGEVWIPYYQCGLINLFNKCEELQSVVSSADTTRKLPIDFKLTASRKIGDGSFTSFRISATVMETGNVSSSFFLSYTRDSVTYYQQPYPPGYASDVINITRLDTLNQIISGTFSFTL